MNMLIQFNRNANTEPHSPSPIQDTQKLAPRLAEKIYAWSPYYRVNIITRDPIVALELKCIKYKLVKNITM